MKIGVFLDNRAVKHVDLGSPELGNPGIGGSEFMLCSLAHSHQAAYPDDRVVLLHTAPARLPQGVACELVDGLHDAVARAKRLSCDIFLCRGNVVDGSAFAQIEPGSMGVVLWAHNFENAAAISLVERTPAVKANVCVSREQLFRLVDTPAFEKSTYIYNAIDFREYDPGMAVGEEPRCTVSYMGSLTPIKGFHLLAGIWPEIERSHPHARLQVIGGGSLYDRDERLGPRGLASADYERRIVGLLEGCKNVSFCGVLGGRDKIDAMRRSLIGIVNPSGRTETFGIGAVEFQALGIPVVTKRFGGHNNTVQDGRTGYLVRNPREMLRRIRQLLDAPDVAAHLGAAGSRFVRENFDIRTINAEWRSLFAAISRGEPPPHKSPRPAARSVLNSAREINAAIKRLPLLSGLPSLVAYEGLAKKALLRT